MIITASVKNTYQKNEVNLSTDKNSKKLDVPGKVEGYGSSVNGGELLFLSLATCFCNDIYREAARRNMNISSVEVTVSGEFGKEGEPGSNIVYEANVLSTGSTQEEIAALIHHVDNIAEVHNTLRRGVDVSLKQME